MMSFKKLFSRRLLIITGKGGVGKTTMALALGHRAALSGRRTIVAELSGSNSLALRSGRTTNRYRPTEIEHNLSIWSLSPSECVQDFAARKMGFVRFAKRIIQSAPATAFIDGVPGMHDLLQLGKIENLLMEPSPSDPKADLIILDAPSTGHGFSLLSAATTMSNLTKGGRFSDLSHTINDMLIDKSRTAVITVSLAEPLPIQETFELTAALNRIGHSPQALVINRIQPSIWGGISPRGVVSRISDAQLKAVVTDDITRIELLEACLKNVQENRKVLAPLILRAAMVSNKSIGKISTTLEEL